MALIKCEAYEVEAIKEGLERAIVLIEGLSEMKDLNKEVLLKPNLLAGSDPDKAVTTHPAVFEGAIELFEEKGYKLCYGDSPGIGNTSAVSQKAGLKEVAEKYELKQAVFNKGKTISFPEGKIAKQFELAEAVLEDRYIVSLAKMKTHQLTRITGVIKNQLGCVYGLNKGTSHVKYPDPVSFSKMLVDLNLLLKPSLYIMDGIVAMEGNGPRSGSPTPMNVLLVSKDPVALDSVFCRLVDINPEWIPVIKYGKEFGLGQFENDEIELVGDDLEPLINKDFDVVRKPVEEKNIKWLSKLRPLFMKKPYIEPSKCIKCGICAEACPVEDKALTMGGGDFPKFDYKKCIRCYCCQEMCPHKAIDVKVPLLGKLFVYK